MSSDYRTAHRAVRKGIDKALDMSSKAACSVGSQRLENEGISEDLPDRGRVMGMFSEKPPRIVPSAHFLTQGSILATPLFSEDSQESILAVSGEVPLCKWRDGRGELSAFLALNQGASH